MRPLLLPLITAFAVTANATPTPTEGVVRMPGLWLMSTNTAGATAQPSSFHVCIGSRARDEVLAHPGSILANCSDERWSKDEHYTYYWASCDAKGERATVEAKFAGDFKYNFQGEFTITFSAPVDGVRLIRAEIDGRRLAPCRGGLPEGKFLIKGQDGVGNLNLGESASPPAR